MEESLKGVQTTLADISYHYNRMARLLLPNQLELKRVPADGNCMFTSIVQCVKNSNPELDEKKMRQIVAYHMLKESHVYEPFVPEEKVFEDEVLEICSPGKWNNIMSDAVPLAMCNIFNEPLIIYSSTYGDNRITIQPTIGQLEQASENIPILQIARLDLDNCEHYDAVITPNDLMLNRKMPVLGDEYGHLLLDFDDDDEVDEREIPIENTNGEVVPSANNSNNEHDDTTNDTAVMQDQASIDDMNNSHNASGDIEKIASRKRKAYVSTWKKNKRKSKRNHGKAYTQVSGKLRRERKVQEFQHGPDSKCRFSCKEISSEERESFHNEYWGLGDVTRQRDLLLKYVEEEDVVTRKTSSQDRKHVSRKFFMPGGKRVCKALFLKTLDISQQVVYTTLSKKTSTNACTSDSDNRGKHTPRNKTDAARIQRVEDHIKSFPATESHYCRKSSSKTYLDSSLNIKIMYRLYCQRMSELQEEPVKEHLYRKMRTSI